MHQLIPDTIFFWCVNQILCITTLTNHFWWLFEPHFFRVYYFSSKQEVLCEQQVNEIMSGCHPSYLKTVSQQVVYRSRTHSLRHQFWLVKMVTHQKFYIWDVGSQLGWAVLLENLKINVRNLWIYISFTFNRILVQMQFLRGYSQIMSLEKIPFLTILT